MRPFALALLIPAGLLAQTGLTNVSAASYQGPAVAFRARVISGQQEMPTFRAGTTLVEFTIVALDSMGNPVTDLKKDEILVTENGQHRDVAFFRFEGAVEKRQPQPLPPGTFSNRPEYAPGQPRNITAIVLDSLNTDLAEQVHVRAQVMQYLRSVAPDTRLAIYRIGERLETLHDFTDDMESLRARIAQTAPELQAQGKLDPQRTQTQLAEMFLKVLSPEANVVPRQASEDRPNSGWFYDRMRQNRRINLTLASLQTLGDHLAGIPGRKSLVWISGGIPAEVASAGWPETSEAAIRRTAQRMATQGITIYPVEANALQAEDQASRKTAPKERLSPTQTSPQAAQSLERLSKLADTGRMWASMDILAAVTGGRVSRETNDLVLGARLAEADVQGAYSVGFYAPGDPDNTWHRLNVKVDRPGLRLAYQQGYQSGAPEGHSPDWSEEDWRSAISNPIGSTAVKLDARCEPAPGATAGVYDLSLQIASGDLNFRESGDRLVAEVDIAAAEKTPTSQSGLRVWKQRLGVPLEVGRASMPGVFSYPQRLTIQPATAIIRLIVRDRSTDRYGTLDVPVKSIPGRTP